MKRLGFVLILLLLLLQYRLWSGANSLPNAYQLQTQIQLQQQSNAALLARNQLLREEINDLRSGTEAIEERARNELGMIKQGETFYRVVEADPIGVAKEN